jgi:hypothetical protein
MLGTDLLALFVSRMLIQDVGDSVTRMLDGNKHTSSISTTYHKPTDV